MRFIFQQLDSDKILFKVIENYSEYMFNSHISLYIKTLDGKEETSCIKFNKKSLQSIDENILQSDFSKVFLSFLLQIFFEEKSIPFLKDIDMEDYIPNNFFKIIAKKFEDSEYLTKFKKDFDNFDIYIKAFPKKHAQELLKIKFLSSIKLVYQIFTDEEIKLYFPKIYNYVETKTVLFYKKFKFERNL